MKWIVALAASIAFSLASGWIVRTWYWTSVDQPQIGQQESPDSTYVHLPTSVSPSLTVPAVPMG